jgi:hypothetical protein
MVITNANDRNKAGAELKNLNEDVIERIVAITTTMTGNMIVT